MTSKPIQFKMVSVKDGKTICACEECKRVHTNCSRESPTCSRCQRLGVQCIYHPRKKFKRKQKAKGASSSNPSSPSLSLSSSSSAPSLSLSPPFSSSTSAIRSPLSPSKTQSEDMIDRQMRQTNLENKKATNEQSSDSSQQSSNHLTVEDYLLALQQLRSDFSKSSRNPSSSSSSSCRAPPSAKYSSSQGFSSLQRPNITSIGPFSNPSSSSSEENSGGGGGGSFPSILFGQTNSPEHLRKRKNTQNQTQNQTQKQTQNPTQKGKNEIGSSPDISTKTLFPQGDSSSQVEITNPTKRQKTSSPGEDEAFSVMSMEDFIFFQHIGWLNFENIHFDPKLSETSPMVGKLREGLCGEEPQRKLVQDEVYLPMDIITAPIKYVNGVLEFEYPRFIAYNDKFAALCTRRSFFEQLHPLSQRIILQQIMRHLVANPSQVAQSESFCVLLSLLGGQWREYNTETTYFYDPTGLLCSISCTYSQSPHPNPGSIERQQLQIGTVFQKSEREQLLLDRNRASAQESVLSRSSSPSSSSSSSSSLESIPPSSFASSATSILRSLPTSSPSGSSFLAGSLYLSDPLAESSSSSEVIRSTFSPFLSSSGPSSTLIQNDEKDNRNREIGNSTEKKKEKEKEKDSSSTMKLSNLLSLENEE